MTVRWLARNLAVVNLVLVFFCVISYIVTIDSLVYWTNWGGQEGEIGGVLDYRWFGESVVYHVSKENLKGERLFSFPDTTSYLLAVLIVLNAAVLARRSMAGTRLDGAQTRGFVVLGLILSTLSLGAYVFGSMMFVDNSLKGDMPRIGGVVDYGFPFYIAVTHVYQGHVESSLNWGTADFSFWLLLALFMVSVAMVQKQLMIHRPSGT